MKKLKINLLLGKIFLVIEAIILVTFHRSHCELGICVLLTLHGQTVEPVIQLVHDIFKSKN